MGLTFRKSALLQFFAALICVSLASGAGREVAITINDLPRGGDGGPRSFEGVRAMTEKLLKAFPRAKNPVIGFVNAGREVDFDGEGLRQILNLWLDYGADLGNHSYSHKNINNVPLDEYTADIVRGEPLLREVPAARGRKLEYYRHPFLFTGPTPEIRRKLQEFPDQHNYRVAPVTFDDSD